MEIYYGRFVTLLRETRRRKAAERALRLLSGVSQEDIMDNGLYKTGIRVSAVGFVVYYSGNQFILPDT